MFRKPAFWIGFTLVAILCVVLVVTLFPQAFPLVTLDLRMDRDAALAAAEALAVERGWGPQGFRQAAAFELDQEVQDYVELEAGGKEAYRGMLGEGLYSPYTWRVRHFKPGETKETRLLFTPAGEPYGFTETLPEDEPGPRLDPETARQIAERAAVGDWRIDLGAFARVESSQEIRPGGRTDHTFVYERSGVTIGEGRYRLRLVVSGDRFTELRHFIKIPEGFSRRFEEMRSANSAISVGAVIAVVLLYLGGGCLVGLFFLLRQRRVIWKPALAWGLGIAFLMFLMGFNDWPLLWMDYDTAISGGSFAFRNVVIQILQLVGMGTVMVISFMAAEGLTRRAFPHHVQFWRVWSAGVANSAAILGRTVAGYLLVGVTLAYVVTLYFFSHRLLGWWSPSDTLVNPNVVASYFPWLGPIAISLQAGFWEECLFRAVPIASAALLGRRFGKQRLWIVGALVLQAIIFGAGHAAYPAMPAYARVVELVLPSIAYGLIYIAFGLVPVIVYHFAFDAILFSLPLFTSSAPGAWIDQVVVVLLTLVPLWVVLGSRWRAGGWNVIGDEHRNRAWTPPAVAEAEPVPAAAAPRRELAAYARYGLPTVGVVGLILWIVLTPFRHEAPPLQVGRAQAVAAARETLAERGIELSDEWRVLSTVAANAGNDDRFVWQEGGQELYRELLGRYLDPPGWQVRFARFEGDVAERAEEYQVSISPAGEVVRFEHRLPEARAGAELDEEEARVLVRAELNSGYELDAERDLREISAVPTQQPARRDWEVTYADPASFPLPEGEARITVALAGDEVVDRDRFVFLPEEWERAERNRSNLALAVQILCGILLFLLLLGGVVAAVVRWSRRQFAVGIFLRSGLLMLVLTVVAFFNALPAAEFNLSTAQPLKLQVLILVGVGLVFALMSSVGLALILGFIHRYRDQAAAGPWTASILPGLALGTAVAGLLALAERLAPSPEPSWAEYADAAEAIPLLATALGPLLGFLIATTVLLLIMTGVEGLTAGWSRRRMLFAVLLVLTGLVFAGVRSVETVPLWLGEGTLLGLILLAVYLFVVRDQLSLIPLAMGALTMIGALRQGVLMAFPQALPGAVLAVVLIAALAVYWSRKLAALGASDAGPA